MLQNVKHFQHQHDARNGKFHISLHVMSHGLIIGTLNILPKITLRLLRVWIWVPFPTCLRMYMQTFQISPKSKTLLIPKISKKGYSTCTPNRA